MNEFWVIKRQVQKISLDQFANKAILIEPELISISWFTHIFGCWHKKLGSPITRGTRTYNTCMNCGACQNFDVKLWKNTGAFHYAPIPALNNSQTEKK